MFWPADWGQPCKAALIYFLGLDYTYLFISHILPHSHVRKNQRSTFYVLEIQDKSYSRSYNWSLLENMTQAYAHIFKCMKYHILSKTLAFHLRLRTWTIYKIWNIIFLEIFSFFFERSDKFTNISEHFLRINKNFCTNRLQEMTPLLKRWFSLEIEQSHNNYLPLKLS